VILTCAATTQAARATDPAITSFVPTNGPTGSVLTIHGSGFGATPSANIVTLSNVNATVTQASTTQLSVLVPPDTSTGVVRVTVGGLSATTTTYFVVWPIINNISPPIASPGASIVIRGRNFGSSVSSNFVAVNGTVASVTAANAGQLNVTVPPTATTGPVTVTVDGRSGQSTWPLDVMSSAPVIGAFWPGTGSVGTLVTVKGKNFSSTPAANTVTLNGVSVPVTGAESSSLTLSIPSGAATGALQISVAGQTAISNNLFRVATSGSVLLPDGPSLQTPVTAAGQSLDLTFDAIAGETLGLGITSVLQVPVASTKKPYVAVFKPDGTLLKSISCPTTCAFDLSALTATGTYTARLFSNNPTSTVSAIAELSEGVTASLLPGIAYPVAMDRPARITRLSFNGIAGQSKILSFQRSYDPLYSMSAHIEVRRPNGEILNSLGSPIICLSSACPHPMLLVNLPESGTYSLLIRSLGEQSFTLALRASDPLALSPSGPTVASRAFFGWDAGLLSFNVTDSQRLDLGIVMPISVDLVGASIWAPRLGSACTGHWATLLLKCRRVSH